MKTQATLTLWTLSLPVHFMLTRQEFCVDTRQSSIASNWWVVGGEWNTGICH